MPAPVDAIGQLVTLIRAQLSARPDKTPFTPATAHARKQAPAAKPSSLEALIQRRIKSIDRDDPKRGRKAFRVFLESVLLAQFGEQLINDPQFYQIVDDVQSAMERDPEVGVLIETAIEHLLAARPRNS
jgi:hypothetical protein